MNDHEAILHLLLISEQPSVKCFIHVKRMHDCVKLSFISRPGCGAVYAFISLNQGWDLREA